MKINILEQIFKIDPLIPSHIISIHSIQGGSINDCYKVVTEKRAYFVKLNDNVDIDFFEAEAEALNSLRKSTEIRVPNVITYNKVEQKSYLVLEFIESSHPNAKFEDTLAEGLFQLHQNTSSCFGWKSNNYIGVLGQKNNLTKDWSSFFIKNRLVPQLELAENFITRDLSNSFEELFRRMPYFFESSVPALIHGDLWRGNVIADEKGMPVLIDPSIYFGIPEMDIGMSQLFGGFNVTLYIRYKKLIGWEDEKWKNRVKVCNLYPLLVHLNLFGVGYLSSIENTFLELGIKQ